MCPKQISLSRLEMAIEVFWHLQARNKMRRAITRCFGPFEVCDEFTAAATRQYRQLRQDFVESIGSWKLSF